MNAPRRFTQRGFPAAFRDIIPAVQRPNLGRSLWRRLYLVAFALRVATTGTPGPRALQRSSRIPSTQIRRPAAPQERLSPLISVALHLRMAARWTPARIMGEPSALGGNVPTGAAGSLAPCVVSPSESRLSLLSPEPRRGLLLGNLKRVFGAMSP